MTDDWLKSMDDRKLVGAVLLDFSAAFNVVDHELLLGKLKRYGFNSAALSWMESYLSRRRQKVFFNGSFSNSKDTVYIVVFLKEVAWAHFSSLSLPMIYLQ